MNSKLKLLPFVGFIIIIMVGMIFFNVPGFFILPIFSILIFVGIALIMSKSSIGKSIDSTLKNLKNSFDNTTDKTTENITKEFRCEYCGSITKEKSNKCPSCGANTKTKKDID